MEVGSKMPSARPLTSGIAVKLEKEWMRDLPPACPQDTAHVPRDWVGAPRMAIGWDVFGVGVRRTKERALVQTETER